VAWPPRFLFISGRISLDFVHTGGEGFRARWERWHTPRDLADWMLACPGLRVRADVDGQDVAAARALREAIWEAAQAHLHRRPIPTPVVRTLNEAVQAADLVPALKGGKKVWAAGARGSQVLASVARDAIDLFGTAVQARLRECKGPKCLLLFVDLSRPGQRAWCTMRRCGNLSKLARYRSSLRKARASSATRRTTVRTKNRPKDPSTTKERSVRDEQG
jgi:predicted RNA-binding Zn ribbon-like protein